LGKGTYGNYQRFLAQAFDIARRAETVVIMYEAAGKIKLISDIQSFPSGFTKREFVVTTTSDKYPQDLKFEVVKDKCTILDSYEAGQDVQVTFDIRGNEFNGKYFVNLSCWKIQSAGDPSREPQRSSVEATRLSGAPSSEPPLGELRDEDDFDDDVPF
jgi:single-strand DNA-binding protein